MNVQLFFCLSIVQCVRNCWRTVIKRRKQTKGKKPSTTFDDLPNECIYQIFSYLNAVDRIRIERVCERWQCISKASWKKVNKLFLQSSKDQTVSFFYTSSEIGVKIRTIHSGIIRSVLSRCGSFISQLFLYDTKSSFNCYILGIVAEYCNNVSLLDFSIDYLDCKEITPIFMFNENLRKLTIHKGGYHLHSCFDVLSVQFLEDLSFVNTYAISFSTKSSLHNMVKRAPALRSLRMDFVDKGLFQIISQKPTIVSLCLDWLGIVNAKDEFLQYVEKLENLQYFYFRASSFDDDCMAALVKNCPKLEALSLYADKLTERGFAALSGLPKLTTLLVSRWREFDVRCLSHIPDTIIRLRLSACKNVTDDIVIPLIYRLVNLEELHLHCPITERTLQEAVVATKTRANGKCLVIDVSKDLNYVNFNNQSPLLKVRASVSTEEN